MNEYDDILDDMNTIRMMTMETIMLGNLSPAPDLHKSTHKKLFKQLTVVS